MGLEGTAGHNAWTPFSVRNGAARGIRITTDTRDAVAERCPRDICTSRDDRKAAKRYLGCMAFSPRIFVDRAAASIAQGQTRRLRVARDCGGTVG